MYNTTYQNTNVSAADNAQGSVGSKAVGQGMCCSSLVDNAQDSSNTQLCSAINVATVRIEHMQDSGDSKDSNSSKDSNRTAGKYDRVKSVSLNPYYMRRGVWVAFVAAIFMVAMLVLVACGSDLDDVTVFRVMYDSNGGSEVANQNVIAGSKAIRPDNPYREGYIFEWWYDKDVSQEFDFGLPIMSNVYLYASWVQEDEQPSIPNDIGGKMPTVDVNEHSDSVSIQYLDCGGNVFSGEFGADTPFEHTNGQTTTLVGASKQGYIFEGWHDTLCDSDSVSITTIDKDKVYEDTIILYAKWQAIEYTISFDSNKPAIASGFMQGKMTDVAYEYDTIHNLPSNQYILGGWQFLGWGTDKQSDSVEFFDGATISNLTDTSKTITMYAIWQANMYTIILVDDYGYGSGVVDVLYDGSIPSVTVPTAVGRVFAGYFDIDNVQFYDAYGTAIDSTYRYNDNKTIYAKWVNNKHYLSLDYMGGQDKDGNSTIRLEAIYGEHLPVTDAPTRDGYILVGFYDSMVGGELYYDADMNSKHIYDIDKDIVLYARWVARVYTITTYVDDEIYNTVDVSYDEMFVLDVIDKYGYVFKGWYKGDIMYASNDGNSIAIYTDTENIDLQAKFEPKEYTIYLDLDSGSSDIPYVHTVFGLDMPSGVSKPTRVGYMFGGYYVDINNTRVYYYDDNMHSARQWDIDSSEVLLVAEWIAIRYTIALDKDGGYGGTDTFDIAYNEVLPLGLSAPSKDGYNFVGYFVAIYNSSKIIFDSEMLPMIEVWNISASNTTLIAKWEASNYTISLDKQGGQGGTSSVYATYDSHMPLALAPTKANSVFVGYYIDKDFAGAMYYSSSMESVRVWDVPSNTTLYAKWIDSDVDIEAFAFYEVEDGYAIAIKDGSVYLSGDIYLPSIYNGSPITQIYPRGFDGIIYYNALKDVTSITIPSTVRIIGKSAFNYNYAAHIYFASNSNLQIIDKEGFRSTRMQDIVLPSSLQRIEQEAFLSSHVTAIDVESNSKLEYIAESAFEECKELVRAVIPAGVAYVGINAYYATVNVNIYIYVYKPSAQEMWHKNWANQLGGTIFWLLK